MSQWIEISTLAALQDSTYERFEFEDIDVLVFRDGSHVYAMEDLCTHDGSDISGGCIVEGAIECPRHGARFCLRTGEVLSPPAYEDLHVFPLKIENGDVWVRDDRWD